MSNKTIVRSFRHKGKRYHHELDLDDDSITLRDEDDNALLHFDSSTHVTIPCQENVVDYGKISMRGKDWVFIKDGEEQGPRFSTDLVEGHLDLEVAVSKMYLDMKEAKVDG